METSKASCLRMGLSGLLMVGLVACGGGGGGGTNSPPASPPPAPSPAPSTVPLALTAANAEDAATLGQGLAHTGLAFAHQAIAWLDELRSAVVEGSQTCRGGGTRATTWLDRNGNKVLDAGDRIEWRLASCWLDSTEERFQGQWAVEVTARDASDTRWAGRLEFGNDFFTGDNGGNAYLEGQLQFNQAGSRLQRELRVGLAPNSDWRLRITPSTSTQALTVDRITQLDARWTSRRDTGRNTVEVTQLTLQSEALKGQVQLRTVQPWSSWLDADPDAGESELSGAGTQRLRIGLGAKSPSLKLRLTLDGTVLGAEPVYQDATQRVLFSSGAWLPPQADALGYPLVSGETQPQRLLAAPAASGRWAPNQRLEWWYARPLGPLAELPTGFTSNDTVWGVSNVPAKVTLEGGLLTVEPASQLAPGATYQLWMPQPIFAVYSGSVDAVVSALLTAPPRRVLVGSGSSLVLDGGGSRAAGGGPVARYSWRQLSGPTLTLSPINNSQLRVQAASQANGVAMVELEVADAAGFVDRRQVSLQVVNDPSTIAWVVRQSGNAAEEWWIEGVQVNGGFGMELRDLPAINAAQWIVGSEIMGQRLPAGSPWKAGQRYRFDTAVGFETHAIVHDAFESACDTRAGHFDIHEVERNPDGSFRRLAVDVDYLCQPSGRRHQAQLRWRSALAPSW